MSLTIPVSFVLLAIVLALMIGPIYLLLMFFRRVTRNRKSPLNIDLLRSPGQSLRELISDDTIDIIGYSLMIPLVALMMYSFDITNRYFQPEKANIVVTCSYVISGILFCMYMIFKVYRLFQHRNKLRLGYDCELAVGQDLTGLLRMGFKVYHDFPADGFNIDHIAVGPTGVFAIETKGRTKRLNEEKENWKLYFDGEMLRFPSWSEREPVQQARRQAQWLSKWIASSTGESQQVVPVLAIPGWFTTYTKQPRDVRLYNGKNSNKVVFGKAVLTEKRINAIAHQIESKCRDVKSQAYKKD